MMKLTPFFSPSPISVSSIIKKTIIAGPCSAETEEQVMQTAKELKAIGITMMRAGIWKPRTRPGGFEGVGEAALKWLKSVKEEVGVQVLTEVCTAKHVDLALEYGIDLLWIGARTTANPFAVQGIADALQGVDIPILVKNPPNPDLELWIGALERLNKSGITKLSAVHRGFSSFNHTLYRNLPKWTIPLELKKRYPHLPLLCDPSHISGKRDMIQLISQQAIDLSFDGLMIESHCDPEKALTDKEQQLNPAQLKEVLQALSLRDSNREVLHQIYKRVDELDEQVIKLLEERGLLLKHMSNSLI